MILKGAENGKHTSTILIDVQKSFNTLDHKMLLGKIKFLDFLDKTIKWFHFYLTNRVFFVSLGTIFLEAGAINCGVTQGPILGPLLFLLYFTSFVKCQYIPLCRQHKYFYRHKDVTEIKNVLKKEFSNDLLIINYQFILVKVKLNVFFSVVLKTYLGLA